MERTEAFRDMGRLMACLTRHGQFGRPVSVQQPRVSCRVAVARSIAHRISLGQSPCSAETGDQSAVQLDEAMIGTGSFRAKRLSENKW